MTDQGKSDAPRKKRKGPKKMHDFPLTKSNLNPFLVAIQDELEKNPSLIVSVKKAGTAKWGMTRLWRAWMEATAKHMAAKGVRQFLFVTASGEGFGDRPINGNDTHEVFTYKWLGVDADGRRLSWAKEDHDGMRKATDGERWFAMKKHEDWCTEKGIILLKPRDSEYNELEQRQEE